MKYIIEARIVEDQGTDPHGRAKITKQRGYAQHTVHADSPQEAITRSGSGVLVARLLDGLHDGLQKQPPHRPE